MKLLKPTKWCPGCKTNRPLDHYHKNKRAPDGLQFQCKDCLYILRRDCLIKNPELYRSNNREWRRRNAKRHGMERKALWAALREEFFEAYGGKCTCCGDDIKEFLTLEHIYRDGKEHRKRSHSSLQLYLELKAAGWPKDRYTLYCMNCNWATRFGAVCPHKRKK